MNEKGSRREVCGRRRSACRRWWLAGGSGGFGVQRTQFGGVVRFDACCLAVRSVERGWEVAAGADVELAVDGCEVVLGGLGCDAEACRESAHPTLVRGPSPPDGRSQRNSEASTTDSRRLRRLAGRSRTRSRARDDWRTVRFPKLPHFSVPIGTRRSARRHLRRGVTRAGLPRAISRTPRPLARRSQSPRAQKTRGNASTAEAC
jgi:hypothetical protein